MKRLILLRRLHRGRQIWGGSGDYRALVGSLSVADQQALDVWLLYLEQRWAGHQRAHHTHRTPRRLCAALTAPPPALVAPILALGAEPARKSNSTGENGGWV